MSERTTFRIFGACWTIATVAGFAALALWMFGAAPLALLAGKLAALAVAAAFGVLIIASATDY